MLAPLAVGLAFAAQEPAAKRSLDFTGGRVEALGACDVRPESVSCWDMDGKAAPDLADSVRGALNGGSEVYFRLGKKNRYLIVRRPQSVTVSYRQGTNGLNSNWNTGGNPATDFLRYAGDPTEKSVSLDASTNVPSARDEEIAFQEGATGEIDGRKVEMGSFQKIDGDKLPPNVRYNYGGYGQPRPGLSWTVAIGVAGLEGQYTNWTYVPLDASGEPIRFVDAAGNPVSALKALELEPNLQTNAYYGSYQGNDPSGRKLRAFGAFFSGAGPGPAFRASTNINPKAIARLRVRASHQQTGILGPFPLDPR